jgi:hypothetical protein
MKTIKYIVVLELRIPASSMKDVPLVDSPESWNWNLLIGEDVKLLSCEKKV